MAKAERKNTICPIGYLSPRKRTSVAITANSSADMTLSEIARTTFMVSDCSPAPDGRVGVGVASRRPRARKPSAQTQSGCERRGSGLTQRGEKRGIVRPRGGPGAQDCARKQDPGDNSGGHHMPTYIVLGSFTEQGLRNIKDSPKRAAAVSAMAKKAGASLKDTYWTLG